MTPKTKVEAIATFLTENGGKATWREIYENIERFYNEAKASSEWQAGIRGVVYREIRNGLTFKKIGSGTFALSGCNEKKDHDWDNYGKCSCGVRNIQAI
jgi:hypothetical protein